MKCAYKKANGQKCQAQAMKGSKFCFTHNPKTRKEHALAVTKGGKLSRRNRLNLEPVKTQSPQDVVKVLEQTINGIRSGEVPPNIANTVGYLCGHLLKAIELAKYANKLETIEKILTERKVTK